MGAAWRLKVAGEESARRFSIMLVLSTGFLIAEVRPLAHSRLSNHNPPPALCTPAVVLCDI